MAPAKLLAHETLHNRGVIPADAPTTRAAFRYSWHSKSGGKPGTYGNLPVVHGAARYRLHPKDLHNFSANADLKKNRRYHILAPGDVVEIPEPNQKWAA